MGLVQCYESCFREHGLHTAQVLLTHADLADRQRYLNARSTLRTLLALGVIPVINENDTVVTDEIKLGDNDTLGALVTNLVEADALVILTDQAGLYDADPRKNAEREAASNEARRERSRARSDGRRRRQRARQGRHADQGAGGAARRAQRRAHRDRLRRASPTCCCASRAASASARCSPRRPCRSRRASSGSPTISRCAARCALDAGAVQGAGARRQEPAADRRDRGDRRVRARRGGRLLDPAGREIARGLVNYSAEEARRIMRRPSGEIEAILGYVDEPELIHRDNLVLL